MKLNLIAFLMGGVLCSGSAHAQGTIWTVDDDGPADFSEIADAIASPSVVDGDVLQVYPGDFEGFVLDKSLRIIGPASNKFRAGWCRVTDVEEFSISGMHAVKSLSATNVSGRGRFDDCDVGDWSDQYCSLHSLWFGWAAFTGCDDLVVTRCEVIGSDACYGSGPFGVALEITSSTVAIVDSSMSGGWDWKYGPPPAVLVWEQSDVTIAGSSLKCGVGPYGSAAIQIAGRDSVVRIRGSRDDLLIGSLGSPVSAHPAATVIASGVTLKPNRLPVGVTWVDPAEAYLRVSGPDDPSSLKSVELYGPPGRLGLVLSSLVPAHLFVAGDLDPLWLDPASLLTAVPLTTIDQETPRSYRVYLPADPSLVGTVLILQCWFPALPAQGNPSSSSVEPMPQESITKAAAGFVVLDGKNVQQSFLTNPANIILRW